MLEPHCRRLYYRRRTSEPHLPTYITRHCFIIFCLLLLFRYVIIALRHTRQRRRKHAAATSHATT